MQSNKNILKKKRLDALFFDELCVFIDLFSDICKIKDLPLVRTSQARLDC